MAAYVALCLPCGRSFVVPSATLAPSARNAKGGAVKYRASRAERGDRAGAARWRWRGDYVVHMVATGPRVDESSLDSVTVAPTRPPGEEGPHLPWTGSVAGPEFPLRYMPFMEHLLNVLARSFGEMTALPLADKLAFVENPEKGARMLSMSFTSPQVRKVRLTYFDAGDKVQVLNAVVYPDSSLDFPLMGIDLISFGDKHLAGVDVQPLFEDEGCRGRFSEQLAPIKAKYPEFSQKMSPRFYDSARFFSDDMLFGRYEDCSVVEERLFPAFEEYLSVYITSLLAAAEEGGDCSPEARARVLDRHRAYDQYNAERDPAHGLFRNYYGEAFAEEFMDKFLFELSTRPPEGYPKGSALRGGGSGGGGGCGEGRPSGGNPCA
eukprot:jgi/Undpi1/5880/HiC_scaffold_2.g01154.m1